MKKTIAILMVLLLLLSGCKAVKKDQTGVAATPVTDNKDQYSETSKENVSELSDNSWKEELGWDDSWTKLEPMSYEEAHKITAEINHRPGENGLSQALTAEEKMAQYVEMKEYCHSIENKFIESGTEKWSSYMMIFLTKSAPQPYEEYLQAIFVVLKETNPKFKNFSLNNIQFLSAPSNKNYITLNYHSDPQTTYAFEEIEATLLEIYQFISSFEGISRLVMTGSSIGSYGGHT